MEFPEWLNVVAVICLVVATICAVIIVTDILAGHRQHMWIMNIVWPVTALYAGPLALWGYFTAGRLSTHRAMAEAKARGEEDPGKRKPFWEICAVGATHCGGGCTLADIIVEGLLIAFPLYLFGRKIFASWGLDFIAAFLFGIAFQYFTIVPMRHLPPGRGLLQALKADALSLTAWQIGMYGWMAIATFLLFGHEIPKTSAVFWFMMQIAMWLGFLTSYPVNWWLIRSGIKEAM